jgi:hypothetical protein
VSNAKFTPGPWQLNERYEGREEATITANTGLWSGDSATPDGWFICQVFGGLSGEETANARLIAAAPELFDVVEVVCNIANDSGLKAEILKAIRPHEQPSFEALLAAARSALAKATGEQT